jgi:hypothetical protein
MKRVVSADAHLDVDRRRLCVAAPAYGLSLGGASWLAAGLEGCTTPEARVATPAKLSAVPAFSSARVGGPMPEGWKPYILRPDRIKTVYSIAQRDGKNTLHASADSASSGLSCSVDIDPNRTPWLRWEWRADSVSQQASVADDITEDTPARIVVAFDGDMSRLTLRDRVFFEQVELFTGNLLPYATLTYVWDGRLPVDRVLPYARSQRIRYEVVESGAARVGKWLRYERNVLDDYRRVFGEAASGHIISVGVLTDSDDLKNHAEAWYGDIGLYAESVAAG